MLPKQRRRTREWNSVDSNWGFSSIKLMCLIVILQSNSGYLTFGLFKSTVQKVTVRCEEKLLFSALTNMDLYLFCPDFFPRKLTNRVI